MKNHFLFGGHSDRYTRLLLHFDSNTSSWKDSSKYNFTIATGGTPTLDTVHYKFGPGSVSLDGSSYINAVFANPLFWNLGVPGTVDFLIRMPSLPTLSNLFSTYYQPSSQKQLMNIGFDGGSGKYFLGWYVYTSSTERWRYVYFNSAPVINTWYHLALVLTAGPVANIYVNGTSLTNEFNSSGDYTPINLNTDLIIGGDNGTIAPQKLFTGNIDEFRWSPGIARWTSNFTPPTRPYSA
jgi:hypothetical protein